MNQRIFVAAGLCAFVICCQARSANQGGVSSASYSMARAGLPSEPEAVLIEEFINYHRHKIPEPMGAALAIDARWGAPACGSNQPEAVLQVGLASTRSRIESDKIPALNLALVIDQSGSMKGDRIENVKKALLAFLDKLRPSDRVSIVGFSDEAHVVLPSHSPPEHQRMKAAVKQIHADGSTNLHAGLMLGYEEVAAHFDAKKTNRVILLTDGQANRGVTKAEDIIDQSLAFNDKDIDMSGIGVGTAFNHRLMRSLTDAGRGLLHFVGDDQDIEKTFVEELESLLAPVARRVSVEIEFDNGLELKHVRGYQPVHDGRRITVPLDDLNHGATQVILARFRAADLKEASELGVMVRLKYTDVASRELVVIERQATVAFDPELPADAPLLTDPMVRKNETIAELAQGIKDLAQAIADTNDPEKASVELTRPLSIANARYPELKDTDIKRVRDILTNYQDLLAKEAERKEEFERKLAEEKAKVKALENAKQGSP